MKISPDKRYGATLPAEVIDDIVDQLVARREFLKVKYPERSYTYKTMAELIGAGKAWVNDLFIKRFTDVRVSSLHRAATVLGCDIKFVLIPKENKTTQLTIEDFLD